MNSFYSVFFNIHQSGVLTLSYSAGMAGATRICCQRESISAHSVYTIQPCTCDFMHSHILRRSCDGSGVGTVYLDSRNTGCCVHGSWYTVLNLENVTVSRLIWQVFWAINTEFNMTDFVSLMPNMKHTLVLTFVQTKQCWLPSMMFVFIQKDNCMFLSISDYISLYFNMV